MAEQEDLVDYEDEEQKEEKKQATTKEPKKDGYAVLHSTSFNDYFLKPELMRALADCGFEHPSEVQQECIPKAIMGVDILTQAKSGMGKTAIFVLSVLQQIEEKPNPVCCLILAHTRELAYQIDKEFLRFCKYFPAIKHEVIYGGEPIAKHKDLLKKDPPHIIVGTPGRISALVENKDLDLSKLRFFILDECDKMLEQTDMRESVQDIFLKTPKTKQVMMFSATLPPSVRPICRKFMKENVKQ